ncbi:pupal cuticle protein 20 [Drosophila busckii]|uniref:pupal cuticle protein 20 n=1 Tax=Drosophila busckii TaxID=30019 RepID=UPI00083F2089|nr:pupal cuticle protein 20 [Drosophila busckii]
MLPQVLLLLLSCLLLNSSLAGRPAQRYLPSNQYLAPQQSSQLHYHGVSSGAGHAAAHAAPRGFAAAAGSSGAGRHSGQHIPIVRSDYQSDTSGNYNFGFDTGNGIHRDETGEFKGGWPHGSLGVRGSYSYTGDDGQQYTVNYKADKNGFHAEGAHLPTSPIDHHHQHRSGAAAGAGGYHGGAGGAGAYHAPAQAQPAARYLPPAYRQRRHY